MASQCIYRILRPGSSLCPKPILHKHSIQTFTPYSQLLQQVLTPTVLSTWNVVSQALCATDVFKPLRDQLKGTSSARTFRITLLKIALLPQHFCHINFPTSSPNKCAHLFVFMFIVCLPCKNRNNMRAGNTTTSFTAVFPASSIVFRS